MKMGFGEILMWWMEASVFTSFMSILVNGSPTEELKVTRGLLQGDPMSPFLFIIVVEGLSGIVGQAVSRSLFSFFKVSNEVNYSLLQFVDDIILIGDASWSNIWAIKVMRRGF